MNDKFVIKQENIKWFPFFPSVMLDNVKTASDYCLFCNIDGGRGRGTSIPLYSSWRIVVIDAKMDALRN